VGLLILLQEFVRVMDESVGLESRLMFLSAVAGFVCSYPSSTRARLGGR